MAQKLLTPSQAMTTRARTSPSGRSVRTPVTRPASSRSRPVTVVDVTRSAPSASALPASQWSKSGRNAVAPLYGGRPHAAVRKSTVSACVSVRTIVERRVIQRCTGISSHHCGCRPSRMRGYTTPPYMFLLPANGPRSSSRTERPARARTVAAHEPAGPAPTTTTSTSTVTARPPRRGARRARRARRWRRRRRRGRPSASSGSAGRC